MTWKKQLQDNITSAAQLREFRQLSEEEERRMDAILHKYPMRVTRYYLSLVDWDNYEEDPIYRLCVPTIREDDLTGSLDTSGESSNTKMPGLQHKYRETALVLTTHECAMYCRHCFRKRLVGLEDEHETVVDPQAVADYVTAHPEVNNVLLSIGVVPYYIFQCRPVTGVGSQFQVPLKEGWQIVETTRGMINGQAKSFKFAMSHVTGKIEIIGPAEDGRMIFKYNQAKSPDDLGRIFMEELEEDRKWL